MDIIPRHLQNLPVLPVLVSVSGGMDDDVKYLYNTWRDSRSSLAERIFAK